MALNNEPEYLGEDQVESEVNDFSIGTFFMFALAGCVISGLYFAQFDKSDLTWTWYIIGGVFSSVFYLFFTIIRSNIIRKKELEENQKTSHKKIGYTWSELSTIRKIVIICLIIFMVIQITIIFSF